VCFGHIDRVTSFPQQEIVQQQQQQEQQQQKQQQHKNNRIKINLKLKMHQKHFFLLSLMQCVGAKTCKQMKKIFIIHKYEENFRIGVT
jgi:hypothetical protein